MKESERRRKKKRSRDKKHDRHRKDDEDYAASAHESEDDEEEEEAEYPNAGSPPRKPKKKKRAVRIKEEPREGAPPSPVPAPVVEVDLANPDRDKYDPLGLDYRAAYTVGTASVPTVSLREAASFACAEPDEKRKKLARLGKKGTKGVRERLDWDAVDKFFGEDKHDKEEPFGRPPRGYAMYGELAARHAREEDEYRRAARHPFAGKAPTSRRLSLPDLELCDVAHQNRYLREYVAGEPGRRPCILGNQCMCMLMAVKWPDTLLHDVRPDDGFVCVEHLRPSEERQWKEMGILPANQQLCLIDKIAKTSFSVAWYESKGEEPLEVLQDHRILVDAPGGYRSDCCHVPCKKEGEFNGIIDYYPKFRRSNWTYGKKTMKDPIDGKKRVTVRFLSESNLNF
jgi:hypothetical protein